MREFNKIKIAVVIATCNRPYKLSNRSLYSVQKQTRKPDYVIVIDDSDRKNKSLNEDIVTEFRCDHSRILYRENFRTKGASGAWNTAFSELLKEERNIFIAILDDDDEWNPNYLKKCEDLIIKHDLDMVVAGITRFDDEHKDGIKLSIPKELNVKDFLIGNPNIQGSNLFLKLSIILEAGGFDEALNSTTDRDLCIRLADLGYVKVGFLKEYLINHYAFSGYKRLSTRGSFAKISGLNYFYRKHRHRMTEKQRELFLKRAEELFGVNEIGLKGKVYSKPLKKPQYQSNEDYSLVIGFISSPIIKQTENLLTDINKFSKKNQIGLKKVIVIENSRNNLEKRKQLYEIIHKQYNFKIAFYDFERQDFDIMNDFFGKWFKPNVFQKSIAASRTMLQKYLYNESISYRNPIVWILDDDSRLYTKYWDSQQQEVIKEWDFLKYIPILKKYNIDVALCTVTGAPPLPFASCIRTQLVDLYHNFERLLNHKPDSKVEDLRTLNNHSRSVFKDYYYDLSRISTRHLEFPFWYVNNQNGSYKSLFIHMIKNLERILCGEQVFRPILTNPNIEPLETMIPSINRGGNTLVLNINTLNEFQNYAPSINGKDTRRSDMIWSLLNKYISDRKIVQIELPITQDRSLIKNEEFKIDFETLKEDIQGYAIYSSLKDIFRKKVQENQYYAKKRNDKNNMHFTEDEKNDFIKFYHKYILERYIAFELSVFRINGIIKMIKNKYLKLRKEDNTYWWNAPEFKPILTKFVRFINILDKNYKNLDLKNFKEEILEVSEGILEKYCSNMFKDVLDFYNADSKNTKKSFLDNQFKQEEVNL